MYMYACMRAGEKRIAEPRTGKLILQDFAMSFWIAKNSPHTNTDVSKRY